MMTGQAGAEAEEVTAQYDDKVLEEEMFIVQNGEYVSPHFPHK